MSTLIRPELSKANKYYISKHRYYELKHMCLQYKEWKQELLYLNKQITKGIVCSEKLMFDSIVESEVIFRDYYIQKIEAVERAAREADKVLGRYILKAVTQGLSFVTLKTIYDIPCERDMYYDRYRKFFYILDKESRDLHGVYKEKC